MHKYTRKRELEFQAIKKNKKRQIRNNLENAKNVFSVHAGMKILTKTILKKKTGTIKHTNWISILLPMVNMVISAPLWMLKAENIDIEKSEVIMTFQKRH